MTATWKPTDPFEAGFEPPAGSIIDDKDGIRWVRRPMPPGYLEMWTAGGASPAKLEQAGLTSNEIGWWALRPRQPLTLAPWKLGDYEQTTRNGLYNIRCTRCELIATAIDEDAIDEAKTLHHCETHP